MVKTKLNSKEEVEKHLEEFNLIQFMYDSEGIIINKAMEKSLKKALIVLIQDDFASLWKY